MSQSVTITSDPERLMSEFVNGRQREGAFLELVRHFSPLIYSSAFRRTGNRDLAEDITQTVLTLLARKAPSLLRHSSLTGWVFQTTRLESTYAMRTEARRSSKHQALAQDPTSPYEMNSPAIWEAALPHLDQALDKLPEREREVILLHFFEGKKHREIALARKISVSASKMQLKRGLERLSSLIQKRGVSLPVATLTTGLAVQFAATSSAKAASLLSTQALKAAPSIGTSTLISNTLTTMTASKKALITTGLILIATSVPAIQQARTNSRLKQDLTSLQELPTLPITVRERVTSKRRHTVRDILAAGNQDIDVENFLKEISNAATTYNMDTMVRAFLPIAAMEREELEALLDEIEEFKGHPAGKMLAVRFIGQLVAYSDQANPGPIIERMLAANVEYPRYQEIIEAWTRDDPDAALQWFAEKRTNGDLTGKGAHTDNESNILGILLGGIAQNDPVRAAALFHQESDPEIRGRIYHTLSSQLCEHAISSGDTTLLQKLITRENEPGLRSGIAHHSAWELSRQTKDPDTGLALLKSIPDLKDIHHGITAISLEAKHLSFGSRVNWLHHHLSEDHFREAIPRLIHTGHATVYKGQSEILEQARQWVISQPLGPLRDETHRSLADGFASHQNFEVAYAQASRIQQDSQRTDSMAKIAKKWLKVKPEEAVHHLPAKLIAQWEK